MEFGVTRTQEQMVLWNERRRRAACPAVGLVLFVAGPECYVFVMTATQVIEEIQNLPREEQSRVLQFAFELARSRQLSGAEIAVLAEQMVSTTDPSEKARLRMELTRGFYGD